MNIRLNLHSVLLSVGPTNCGKTSFFKTNVIPVLENYGYNVGYISSDDIRTELLGESNTIDKYNSRMIEVSQQAFIFLKCKLECYISFPVNKHFVIVDTTGLNKDFRDEIFSICNKHNYSLNTIVFNYSDIQDYFMFDCNKKVIKNHIERLKQSLKNIQSSTKYTIKHRSLLLDNNITICIDDDQLYKKCIGNKKKYLIVGDIHGCIDEFKQLLIKVGFLIDDTDYIKTTDKTNEMGIILVGDIIDKGSHEKIQETIEFIHKNLLLPGLIFHMVTGNHEGAVYNLLTGKTKESEYKNTFIETFYNSYSLLKSNENLRQKFYDIFDNSIPFFHNKSENGSFYVTHSPCDLKYIGKLNPKSIKKQMYTFLDREKTIIDNMNNFIKNNAYNFPYHIVGHIAIDKIYDGKLHNNNILMIDTGCIYNNKLTGVVLGNSNEKYKAYTVPFMNTQPHLTEPLQSMVESTNIYLNTTNEDNDKTYLTVEQNLDKETRYRLESLISDKINYISGTISPAPQNKQKTNLEDLEEGLLYYKNSNISKVCLQRKYMGSRCNIYLFQDINKSYSVSRNGRIISLLCNDMLPIYQNMLDKLLPFMIEYEIEMILLDGELMPWSALGKSLIDKCFRTTDIGISSELEILRESGFNTRIDECESKISSTDFRTDINTLRKNDLINKYGKNDVDTYTHIQFFIKKLPTIEERTKYYELYKDQINIYGSNDPLHYKPFGILKLVKINGDEIIPGMKNEPNLNNEFTQFEIFDLISDDTMCIIDFAKDNWLQYAQSFFDEVTTKDKMEGIIIKPELFDLNFAINIKVRNPDYLSIIYGYDYLHKYKYDKLVNKKNIKRKLQLSIKEANIGYQLLKQPYTLIGNNSKHKLLLIDFMNSEKKEDDIDPRL